MSRKYHNFYIFSSFFAFFCLRRVAGVSALFCPVLLSWLVAGGFTSLYAHLAILAGCRLACLSPILGGYVSSLSRLRLFVCRGLLAGVAVSLSRCVCFGASICRGFGRPVSVAGSQTFEQVFRTSVRLAFRTRFLMPFVSVSQSVQPNLGNF